MMRGAFVGGEKLMIRDYIEAALRRAHYELIDDAEPYYGAVPGLQGVWASGKSLEQCRDNLADVVEGWVLIRLARGLAIPPLGEVTVVAPQELIIA
jgi:predicted RNase H-like HicB family nuclease